jgi:hypothetical protein
MSVSNVIRAKIFGLKFGLGALGGRRRSNEAFLFAPDSSTRRLGDKQELRFDVPRCARCLIEP